MFYNIEACRRGECKHKLQTRPKINLWIRTTKSESKKELRNSMHGHSKNNYFPSVGSVAQHTFLNSIYLTLQVGATNNIFKMAEIKIEDQKKNFKTWTLPGNSLSQHEFLEGIQKAEEGPFNSVPESMENFEQWLKSREKR